MKSDHIDNRVSDINSEACAWIAQLESGDLTAADLEAFREWMRRSSRHVHEIKRLARLSQDLNVLTEMAEPLREASNHYHPVVTGNNRSWGLPVIAMVASLLIAVSFFFVRSFLPGDGPILLATPVGGYLEQRLSDGTVVKLNTNSRIEVLYNKERRLVKLHWGEVLFEVEHNPDRPFLVHAGAREVWAVGTAFVVRREKSSVEVLVTEGIVKVDDVKPEQDVAVSDPSASSQREAKRPSLAKPIFLEARQFITLLPDVEEPELQIMSEMHVDRKLAWRSGLFDFSDMPLEKVIRELERHTNLRIEIVDPELRTLKFDGIFPTGDVQLLFEALESAYGVHVDYVGKSIVTLSLTTRS